MGSKGMVVTFNGGAEECLAGVGAKCRAGWRARKDERGEWEDLCPDCQKAEKDGNLEDRI